MELRDARESDVSGIQRVARESLAASYDAVLDDEAVDAVVETEYGADRVAELLADPETTFVVAADDDVAGFAQGHLVRGDPVVGDIHWLHVHPDERGQKVGVQLLGELVDRFGDENAAVVRGHVVAANEDGGAFYEAHGFEQRAVDSVEIAGETYDERVYEHRLDGSDREEIVDQVTGPDGDALFVDYAGGERGTEAPMYPVFVDEELADRWGFLCGNCESTATSMDASGRVKCEQCGNTRTATRWDDSYL